MHLWQISYEVYCFWIQCVFKSLWIWFLYRLMCMGHVWVLMNREDHQWWRAETSSSASVTESISFGGTLSPWRRAWWASLFLYCTQDSLNWPTVNCFEFELLFILIRHWSPASHASSSMMEQCWRRSTVQKQCHWFPCQACWKLQKLKPFQA